ncbi:MAG: site-specific integrase [Williamsia sp.]|nr:site-specific integrase [Williamsia sp.]
MSVKVILRKETKKDGTSPLAIRITKGKKSSYVYLDFSLRPEQWDEVNHRVKKSHPNSVRLNNYIVKKLSEATDTALDLETQKGTATPRSVRQSIKPKIGSTFFEQAKQYQDNLEKSGKFNRLSAEKPRIKHFRDFLGGKDIEFSEITKSLLERYKAYLKGARKINDRTISNHLVLIRSVISQAINDQIVDPKYYPFGKGRLKIKFPDTGKVGLTREEVKRLEEVELNERQNHARNLWLFSYYNAGMRVSDVMRLQWKDVQDGRISYIMGKNDRSGSLKLPEKALAILEEYKEDSPTLDLIFPDLKGLEGLNNDMDVQRRIKTRVRNADGLLKLVAESTKINKTLTMHISRHTFAQLAGDKIPIPVLQRLYRHTHISTTIGYQNNFIHKETDDALELVLNS